MMLKKILIATSFVLGASSHAYEEPDYGVIKTIDHVEIRSYRPNLVAEVSVASNFSKAGNEAFDPLFKFISGNNVANEKGESQKIKMTTPVTQMSNEKIAMTLPVIQEPKTTGKSAQDSKGLFPKAPSEGEYKVRFVMPKKFTKENLPKPKDPRVKIIENAKRCMAAIRYTGFWSEGRYRKFEKKLGAVLNKYRFKVLGSPIFARYNSPFSLWFLRRNEIWVEIDAKHCLKPKAIKAKVKN